MNTFQGIVKNSKKYNDEIHLARELILDIDKTKSRDGSVGASTTTFGNRWFATPKGYVLFKTYVNGVKFNSGNIRVLNEVICNKLADKMHILCAQYTPALLVNGNVAYNGVASVNFLKDNEKIFSAYELFGECPKNIRSIMAKLASISSEYNIDYENIFYGLYQMAVFDLITFQEDRHLNNISFIVDENGNLKFAPLFDNELSFFVSCVTFNSYESGIEDVSEYVDNYFVGNRLLSVEKKREDFGSDSFLEIIDQLVKLAKTNKKCDNILKNVVHNANLKEVYKDLELEGYEISNDYKMFTIEVVDFARELIASRYKKYESIVENSK